LKQVYTALFAAALAFDLAVSPSGVPGEEKGPSKLAFMIEIDGAIGPAASRQVKEGLAAAAERHGEVVILRLNTPGGLVNSMREIIADILASPVPVVGFVAPSGAHAASAGTYILYATDIAAMAPGTNLGAATPVEIGGGIPGLPGGEDGGDHKNKDEKGPATGSKETLSAKATNDAVAFIRSLAELRGRNADWGEKAVREAASLSANVALEQGVIDLIAHDNAELLDRIDGRTVEVAGGTRQLMTKGLPVETLEPGWLIRLLSVITDPNIAFILMLVGIYGIFFEFYSPGAVAPGVIGTISLLLGLYALNLLPIDYTGLALMMLGIAFLIVEAINPTVVLGLGGLVAFLLGAAVLFKVEAPGYRLSWPIVGMTGAIFFGMIMLAGRMLWAARRRPARVGAEAMRGLPAEILDWRGGMGHVLAQGERWQAQGEGAFKPGERVEVVNVKGLTLEVQRRVGAASDGEFP